MANKYATSTRNSVIAKSSLQKDDVTDDKSISKPDVDSCEVNKAEKLSATEATTPREEPFRPRASTFPGKTQRPAITTNKLKRDKSAKENSEQIETAHPVRIYKSKTDHDDKRTLRRDVIQRPTSPVFRQESPYQSVRETMVSPTSRCSRNSQPLVQFRKHSGIQRRIANSQKAREIESSRDSLHDDEVSSVSKHMLSRPTRTNRFTRASLPVGSANTETIMEQVSEISCPTPSRPISSLNSPAQTFNFRSATPVLPSLGK